MCWDGAALYLLVLASARVRERALRIIRSPRHVLRDGRQPAGPMVIRRSYSDPGMLMGPRTSIPAFSVTPDLPHRETHDHRNYETLTSDGKPHPLTK